MPFRASIAAAAVLLAACGPSVPPQLKYRVVLSDADAYVGAPVQRDGAAAGVVTPAGYVEITTPSSVRAPALHLSVAVPSQCGPRSVPIVITAGPADDKSVAQAMATSGFVLVDGMVDILGLSVATVLVDRSPGDTRPVRIGGSTLPPTATRARLVVGDCNTSAPVRVGDEAVGTWHAWSVVSLVSTDAAACHQLTTIAYGRGVAGMPVVFEQRVRALQHMPDFFLRPAPEQLPARGDESYAYELVRTECPADRSFIQQGNALAADHNCMMAMPSLRRAVGFDEDDVTSATNFVRCVSTEDEALETARRTAALHPEARAALVAVLAERGFTLGF